MKDRITTIVAAVAGGCAVVAAIILLSWVPNSPAQQRGSGGYVQGPSVFTCLTNPADIPFIAVGGGTAPGPSTNLGGLAVQKAFPIGARGYAIAMNCSGTNATTTTNITIEIEYTVDGVDYVTNNRTSFIVTPLGVTYAPWGTNNWNTDVTSIMGNFVGGRVRSIHHTNLGSIFITNLSVSVR